MNLGGVAAVEDLAKQIQICVEVSNDPVSVTEQEMPSCRLFGGMLLVRSVSSGRPSPAQRRSRGRVWWYAGGAGNNDAADGSKVHAPGVDGTGRGKADKGRSRSRGNWKKAGGGSVAPAAAI